jgi:hypothetical protein
MCLMPGAWRGTRITIKKALVRPVVRVCRYASTAIAAHTGAGHCPGERREAAHAHPPPTTAAA